MVYIPNIPQPTDTLAQSQPQILGNFTALNTQFGVDHVAFTGATNNGMHNKISLIGNDPIISPIPITQEGMTFMSNTSGGVFTLSCVERSGGVTHGRVQLTAKTLPLTAAKGRSFLPGKTAVFNQSMGLLIQWGMQAGVASKVATNVSFSTSFDGSPYAIIATLTKLASGDAQPANVVDGSVGPNGFDVYHSSTGAHDIYWVAIGKEP